MYFFHALASTRRHNQIKLGLGGGGVAKNSVEKLFQATPISMELVLDTILRCVNEEGNSKLVVPFCVEEFKVVIF